MRNRQKDIMKAHYEKSHIVEEEDRYVVFYGSDYQFEKTFRSLRQAKEFQWYNEINN